MSRFAPKYPAYVAAAILRAVAAGHRAKEIRKHLATGELEGLDGRPTPMPERTVRDYVARARGQLKAGVTPEAAQRPSRIAALIALRKGLSAEEVVEETGAPPVVAVGRHVHAGPEDLSRDELAEVERLEAIFEPDAGGWWRRKPTPEPAVI